MSLKIQLVLRIAEQVLDDHDTWLEFFQVETGDDFELPPFDIDRQDVDMIHIRRNSGALRSLTISLGLVDSINRGRVATLPGVSG